MFNLRFASKKEYVQLISKYCLIFEDLVNTVFSTSIKKKGRKHITAAKSRVDIIEKQEKARHHDAIRPCPKVISRQGGKRIRILRQKKRPIQSTTRNIILFRLNRKA